MYLYISGPIPAKIEAALNLAAGYPITKSLNETIVSYDNGYEASGNTGVLTATYNEFVVDNSEYTFTF
jgi:hypothetical protein